jgi:MATE family multidrug resistance protein
MPTGAHFLVDISSWALFVSVVIGTRFGTEQLAATNIIFQYLHLSFMPAVGIGIALAAMTGKAIGRRDFALAERQVRHATAVCMGYMGACGLVFLLARHPLMALMTEDPVVAGVGVSLFIWAALFQVFDGLGIAAMNALRGAGDTFAPSVYNALLEWTILIGGGFLVGWLWPAGGAIGPWMMATVYIIVVGLVLWTRFARGGWREINIFRHESEPDRSSPGVETVKITEATGPIDPPAPPVPAVAPAGALED